MYLFGLLFILLGLSLELGFGLGIFWDNYPQQVWGPGAALILMGLAMVLAEIWPSSSKDLCRKELNREEIIREPDRRQFDELIKAARQGDMAAQYRVGILYLGGGAAGTEQNDEEAFFWLSLAAQAGELPAASKRDEVLSRLSAEQVTVIQTRIQELAK